MGWGLGVPSLEEAAALLVAASVIDIETDRGTLVSFGQSRMRAWRCPLAGHGCRSAKACTFTTEPEPIPAPWSLEE